MVDPTPAAAGAAGAGPGAQGAPPTGTTPATAPTQNRGFQAAGLQQVGMAVKLLESALAKVGATSPIGDAVMKALNGLAKHIPPGTVSPAGEQNEIQNMAMRNVQQQGQVAAMRGAGGGGGPPGAGAGAG